MMKRRGLYSALLAAVLLLSSMLMLTTTANAAPDGNIPSFALVDDMSDASLWTSPTGGSVSAMRYNGETSVLSSGEGDTGYIAVRDYDAYVGVPVSVSRRFDTPVNMYRYDKISFYINITPADQLGGTNITYVSGYRVNVTAASGESSVSYSSYVSAGGWVRVDADFGDWNMRSRITDITISVISEISGGAVGVPVRTNFRVDAITMTSARDTSFEDRFLCTDVASERMSYAFSEEKDAMTVRRASVPGRLDFSVSVPSRDGATFNADRIRVTVSDTTGSSLTLTYVYDDGAVISSEAMTIPASGMAVSLLFPVENVGEITNIYFDFDGDVPGEIMIYAVEAVYSDTQTADITAGTVDTCRMLADGRVNIRGQIRSDIVADHINASVAIYCVPIYGDIDDYIFGSSQDADDVEGEGDGGTDAYAPVGVIDITTRFNVTVSPDALPTAYRAMRFAVYLVDGDEKLPVGQSRTVDFSEEAGARLPTPVPSVMGLYTSRTDADASVIMTDVVLDELFGTATTGRIYSSGRTIYYFDNEYLALLDEKIKRPSLCGASCYIRLIDYKDGIPHAVTSSDEESFSRLYAAVDYLTQRYSSADYGFIRGIAIGENCVTDAYRGEDLALDTARTLAVVYGAGRGNISGFRAILSIGDTVAGWYRPYGYDAAMLLCSMERTVRSFGAFPYYVLAESERSAEMSDTLTVQLSQTPDTSGPSGQLIICRATEGYALTGAQLMSDYISKYCKTCEKTSVIAFLYDIDGASAHEDEKEMFMSALGSLDTEKYRDAFSYAGSADDDVPESSHPLARMTGKLVSDKGISGVYNMFDFTDTFDSAGWFPLRAAGECATVRVGKGERALRADGASGGIMTFFDGGLDLTEAPIIGVECFADKNAECEVAVYAASGTYRVPVYVRDFDSTFYIDLSGFAGISGVYGMAIIPDRADSGDDENMLYVSRVSLCSRTNTSGALEEIFSTPQDGGETTAHEEKILEIMAVSLLALAGGAASVALLYRKSGDASSRRRDAEKRGERIPWTNTD